MSFAPVGAIIVLAVPALLIAFVPRRWTILAMILWLLSPAIVFVVLDLIGKVIGPPETPQPGSAVDALLLVGSFLLVPWLLSCLVGFGIGFAVRGRLHRRLPEPGPAEAPVPAQASAAEPPVAILRPIQLVAQGVSADGTLRYEHRPGEFINGRYDSVSDCAVLIDAATGQVLVDCAGWRWSEISANADGSLFLHLQQNQFDSLFRIDGQTGMFRDQSTDGGYRPLAALAQAVKEAWLATAPHASPPHYRRISPDGTIRVDLASEEWSNSQWVNAPRVIDIASGRILLDLWGTDWDATASFAEVNRVRLDCRRYQGGAGLSVVLDAARGCYQITLDPTLGGTLPESPLDGIAQGLETAWRRGAAAGTHRASPVLPHPLAAWRAGLLILVGALIVLAGVAYMSSRLGSQPQQLTPMPKMMDFRSSRPQNR
jgi:hypothetical protein